MNFKISGFADEIDGSLVKQVDGFKKLGINHIEMRGVDGDNLIFHDNNKISEIKKYLDENGMALSALGSPLGKIGIRDEFVPHFEAFKRAVETAHMMDCENIRMFSFYMPEGAAPMDCEVEVFDRLGRFVDYAVANDVVLLHENEKGIYGQMAGECRKLMDTFYGDHFKAIFDFANFVQCRQDTLSAYRQLKPFISYIHVKDALWEDGKVVPVGYGDGNVREILKDLYSEGFKGFLSLEPHLFNFAGLASLEQNGKTIENQDGKILSGMEAFTLAHESLCRILKDIDC